MKAQSKKQESGAASDISRAQRGGATGETSLVSASRVAGSRVNVLCQPLYGRVCPAATICPPLDLCFRAGARRRDNFFGRLVEAHSEVAVSCNGRSRNL